MLQIWDEANFTTYCQIDDEDFVNFCGLVRKHKLSELTMLSTIIQLLDPFLLLPLQLCLLDLDSFLFEMLWVVTDPSFNFGSYGLLKFSSKLYYRFWLSSLVRVFVLSYEDFSNQIEMQLHLHESNQFWNHLSSINGSAITYTQIPRI